MEQWSPVKMDFFLFKPNTPTLQYSGTPLRTQFRGGNYGRHETLIENWAW